MRVKLSLGDRLQLQNVLPSQSDYLELTLREDVVEKTKLTQEQIEDWKVITEGAGVKWEADLAKDLDYDFTDGEAEYIRKTLEKLNTDKKLTVTTANIYKLFVVNKEVEKPAEEKKDKK